MSRQRILQVSMIMVLLGGSLSARASSLSISIGDKGVHFSVSNNDHQFFVKHDHPLPRSNFRHRNLHSPIYSKHPRIPSPRRTIVTHPHKTQLLIFWLRNSNGSQSKIVLTLTPYGYRGPKGEYYTPLPTHRQLHRAYGF